MKKYITPEISLSLFSMDDAVVASASEEPTKGPNDSIEMPFVPAVPKN